VEAFVESFEEYSRYFVKNKVIFADEFYFWAVARELKMNFKIGQATTYSDWSIRRISADKIERNPRWFHKFDDHMLNRYRKSNFIYVRKIEKNTIVDTDPLQDQKTLDSSLKEFKIGFEDEQFSRTIRPLRK
jgi:CTP:phosphocholine cytidylyltransferase-like protein